jgi:hypothetical protein
MPDIWFNFEVDTLHINPFGPNDFSNIESEWRYLKHSDTSKVKNLSLQASRLYSLEQLLENFHDIMNTCFCAANNITIIDRCHMPMDSADLLFMDIVDIKHRCKSSGMSTHHITPMHMPNYANEMQYSMMWMVAWFQSARRN